MANLVLNDDYRFKRSFFGKYVLQMKTINHICKDLNGSGYYDEYDVEKWVNVGDQELIALYKNQNI
jgi:hypothetical protein